MKILNIYLIIPFLTIYSISAVIENITFELDEIIFELNAAPALNSMGMGSFSDSMVDTYHHRLIDLIESEEKKHKNPQNIEKAIYRNRRLPVIWCNYLLNKISGDEANKKITSIISNNAGWFESFFLHKAAGISFDPEKEVGLLNPNKQLCKLLRHLKKCGINLYILTNKNTSTIEVLIKKHPEIMKYFNNIICSGQSGFIKPHADAFNFLINSHQLDPEKTLIIEKEIDCYKKAQALGFKAILFKNFDDLLKKLQKENVITAPL